jgi:hypothetical protein
MTLETISPSPPGDGTSALASVAPTPPTLTLRALVDRVASAMRTGVPRDVWVEAAIVGVRRRGGGYALELGENVATHAPAGARLETYLPDRALAAISTASALACAPKICFSLNHGFQSRSTFVASR